MALLAVGCVMAFAGLFASDALAAQPSVRLGKADSFAVLAGTTVTNSGPSMLNGDLGVSPGTAVTGFRLPGVVNGSIRTGGAASQAQSDLQVAYNDAAARAPSRPVIGDLGGSTRTAGVYKSATSLGLTGTLTLDAQGDANAVFVFQSSSTLTSAPASRVKLTNGAQPCNVFWQVGSSATLGTSSAFAGNILASQSIAMNNGVTLTGRALARHGAVTLSNDTISIAHCAAGSSTLGHTTGSCTTPHEVKHRPARPVLRKPQSHARLRASNVKFSWHPAARAARYTLIVDQRRMSTGCATRALMRLSTGTHHYRVLAKNSHGSRSSRTRAFSTRSSHRKSHRKVTKCRPKGRRYGMSWAPISNGANTYIIGNCKSGLVLHATYKDGDKKNNGPYFGGLIGGHFKGCGAVQTRNLHPLGSRTRTRCTKANRYRNKSFLFKVNCRHTKPKQRCQKRGGFSGDPATKVLKRCQTYANYRPWLKKDLPLPPDPVVKWDPVQVIDVPNAQNPLEARKKGKVRWRYITSDKHYVLIHDYAHGRRGVTNGAVWVFVKSGCVTTPHARRPSRAELR